MAPEPLRAGQIGSCETCGKNGWAPSDGHILKHIPAYSNDESWPIRRSEIDNQLFRELMKPRRTRLISKDRYGKNQRKTNEHLEDLFGEERPNIRTSSENTCRSLITIR